MASEGQGENITIKPFVYGELLALNWLKGVIKWD